MTRLLSAKKRRHCEFEWKMGKCRICAGFRWICVLLSCEMSFSVIFYFIWSDVNCYKQTETFVLEVEKRKYSEQILNKREKGKMLSFFYICFIKHFYDYDRRFFNRSQCDYEKHISNIILATKILIRGSSPPIVRRRCLHYTACSWESIHLIWNLPHRRLCFPVTSGITIYCTYLMLWPSFLQLNDACLLPLSVYIYIFFESWEASDICI